MRQAINTPEPAGRDFWVVCGATLLFFGAFYTLLIPLPLALTALGLPDSQVGAILAAFGIASLLGRPLAGLLGDRVGLRPVMIVGAASFVAGALAFSLASQPWMLFGLRVLQALGYVAFTTATTALVATLAPPARRGALIALFGVSANLAMTLTPASVNAALPTLGLRGAFWLAAGLAVLAAVLGMLVRAPAPARQAGTAEHLLQAMRPPAALVRPMLASLLLGFGFGAFLQFLPLLAERRALAVGWAYTVYG
ncbi:MAG TPA: MFS transporter, partial [Roseiflexaceae bacterium]|nr:MFS transporter [Roseiflexaceae bacterium]